MSKSRHRCLDLPRLAESLQPRDGSFRSSLQGREIALEGLKQPTLVLGLVLLSWVFSSISLAEAARMPASLARKTIPITTGGKKLASRPSTSTGEHFSDPQSEEPKSD